MCKTKFLLLINLFVLLSLVQAQGKSSSSSRQGACKHYQFRCNSGNCINSQRRCDQKSDCLDGSDEVGCSQGLHLHSNTTTVNSNSTDMTQVPSSTAPPLVVPASKPRTRKLTNKNVNQTNGIVEDTLHLLEEGDKQIELRPDYRDLVLVAGLTGSGKTTITKFITNPNDLEAFHSEDRILIRDRVNDSISVNSTVVSKTIFPQLLIHGPSNTAFFDLPGFQDTRNATIEIANAFFMKKVAEHAQRIKILLIVSHNTLRSAGTRTEFKMLIEQLIKFVKDIGKFSQSIVLVASKVEDRRSNDRVINSIGKFLEGVENDLDQIFQDPEKLGHAKIFLSGLLEKDEETGKYTRLGMFRQPKTEGLLSENPDFTTNRDQVEDIVLRRAQFVPTLPGDFGFSVSADATLFTKTLAMNARKKVALLIEELTEVTEEELFEYPGYHLGSSQWQLLRKWTREHGIFHQMTNALSDVEDCPGFLHVLNETVSVFSIPGADEVIQDLFKLNKQLGFFDTINHDYNAPPQEWLNSFDKLETRVGQKIRKLAEDLNTNVMNITSAISSGLKQQTLTLMSMATTNMTVGNGTMLNRTETGNETVFNTTRPKRAGNETVLNPQFNKQTLFENLSEDFSSISRMLSQLLTTSTFAQFSNVTLNTLESTHLQVPPSVLTSLRDINFDMNFNSGINGQRFPFKIDIWVKPIELFVVFLQIQIQSLSFQFSEETRRQNEARMNQQLRTLREETRLAAEKAKQEANRLALDYQKREDSLNGSLTTLAADLAKVRQEQKEEREEVKKQLAQREELFNTTLVKLKLEREKEREALGKQLEQRENSFNGSLTKLRLDHEKEREEMKTQLEKREQSFKGSLAQVRQQQEKEREATRIQLEQREESFNMSMVRLEKQREMERELANKQLEEREEAFNEILAQVKEAHRQGEQAIQAQLGQLIQQRNLDQLRLEILLTKTFPKSHKFNYNNAVVIEKKGREEVGTWGAVEYCPQDSIVTGFQLKYVPYRGSPGSVGQVLSGVFTAGITTTIYLSANAFDDYGVIGVELYCTSVVGNSLQERITSDYFTDADIEVLNNLKVASLWHGSFSNSTHKCPDHNPAVGFKIKNQPDQGVSDDFGTVNFNLICSGPNPNLPDPEIIFDINVVTGLAKWSDDVLCPTFTAVCGIQTKMHRVDKSVDSSGLTNVRLLCCKLSGL